MTAWSQLRSDSLNSSVSVPAIPVFDQGLNPPLADVISDLSLVVLPVYLLRRTKINQRQRIMIFSAFSASLLITAVTILHSVVLFTVRSNGTIVIGHAKVSHVPSAIRFLGVSFKEGSGAKKRTNERETFSSFDAHATRRSPHTLIPSLFGFIFILSDSRGIRGDRRRFR